MDDRPNDAASPQGRPVDTTAPVPIASTQPIAGEPGASSTQPASEGSPDLVGRILGGRYAIERVIGRGGMGIVYEARHVTVGRRVAVKVLRPDLARNDQALARFEREARAAAAIGNEHIVEVFDFGLTDDGSAFLAMEMLEGEDLGALLRRAGPMPEGRAVGVVRQVAVALQAAHEKGIIHRDLKSENVFILARDGRDFAKVVDFGISKVHEPEGSRGPITHEGVVMGTPHYMAPEQGTGGVEPDHRIDVYAMGCLLFEMLTGRLPYSGATPLEVVFKHVHEPIPTPSRVLPSAKISPALDAVVRRAMAKDREKRFASARAFLEALPDAREMAGGERAYVTEPPDPSRRASPVARWKQRVIFAALVAVGGLTTELSWRTSFQQRAERRGLRPVAALARDASVTISEPQRGNVPIVSDASAPPRSLVVLVSPSEAALTLDDVSVGTGGFTGRFERGSTHILSASADGYLTRTEALRLDDDRTLRWTLLRAAPHPIARPPRVHRADVGTSPVGPEGLKQSPYAVGPR